MPPVQPYVLNTPLTVAVNLRYTDANGDLVDRLYPNDYTELIGANLSTLITHVNLIDATLASYNTRITTLESEVAAIQSSGTTFMLYVNGGCLNGNVTTQIDTQVASLTASECAYITALGSTTALSTAVAALNISALNVAPAFSQNSAMAALPGWNNAITNTAGLTNDLALAYLDARAGITKVLAAVTPTCAQVIIDYQAVNTSSLVFSIFFSGYSYIPTAYADNGSTVTITDTSGNIYTTGFNILTQSTDVNPLTLNTSGSTLSATSITYQVTINSKVTSASLGTTCEKMVIKTIDNIANSAGSITGTADVSNFSHIVSSGTTAVVLVNNLSYTPRAATITYKNGFSSAQVATGGVQPYLVYDPGKVTMNMVTPTSASGAFDIDIITYR